MNVGSITKKIKNNAFKIYLIWFSLIHPIKKDTIVFSSFGGIQYSDNPRAISEAIHELYPEYRLVWIVDKEKDKYNVIPDYVSCVRKKGISKYRVIASAACYVYNYSLEPFMIKNRNQFFIQTWHGDRGFKRILFDAWKNGKERFPVMDGRLTDIAVSGSKFGTAVYHSAFHYHGKIIEVGSPRNDKLINDNLELCSRIKKKLNIEEKAKILLYAPTFRDNQTGGQAITIDIDSTLENLKNTTQSDWICLVRTHPVACGFETIDKKNTINVSDYPDMADLLCVADFLITDYSSSLLDYYLTGKPSVCVIFDEDDYLRSCREFKVKPEESGAVIARTQDELNMIICTYKNSDYLKAYEKIKSVYGTCESGFASYEVAKIIDKYLKKNY